MFKLVDNPFVVLGVTPRSTKADIHHAVEDALLDAEGADAERRLDIARQAVIAPNHRLRAELSYLLEMRPAEVKKALRSQRFQEWLDVADATAGLSKANAMVQAIATQPHGASVIEIFKDVFDCWVQIESEEIVTRINENRSVAGFSEVQHNEVHRGLRELREFHAGQVLQGLDSGGILSKALTDLIANKLIPEDRMGEPFSTAVLDEYQRRTGGALLSAADRVMSCLEAYANSGSEEDFSSFERKLEKWDRLAQPLQLASESKDADEAHSKDLYEKIRSAAIDLANNEDRHEEALRITSLSARVFAELPWAADALKKDANALHGLLADKSRNECLAPLASAVTAAQADLPRTSRQLASHGFASTAPDPIGALWRNYANLLRNGVEREIRDRGANMVRGLSVELFNERQGALQANMLTSQLAADGDWFSGDLQKKITDDQQHLEYHLRLQQLIDAIKREDWKQAKEMADGLVQITPPSDRSQLRKLDEMIDQKIRGQRLAKFVWGGIAAVVIGSFVLNNNESTESGSGFDYTTSQDPAGTPTTIEPTIGEVLDNADEQVGKDEEMAPSVFSAGALSLPEVRYCLRQSERVDLARSLVGSEVQQSRYNSAVSDLNSRCSSFRYEVSDMATARSEIANMRSELLDDAEAIVGAVPSEPATVDLVRTTTSLEPDYSLDGDALEMSDDPAVESPAPGSADNETGEENP